MGMSENQAMDGQGSSADRQPVQVPREYPPVPLVGVAAAVFDEQGRVLLVKRGRPPDRGLWGLPGGLLDLGEKLQEGVQREIREECGIEVRVWDVVGVFEPILWDHQGRVHYHYVVVDYWASHVSGEPAAQDDADAVAWVAMTALDQFPMRPETRQVILKAHRMWQNKQAASP